MLGDTIVALASAPGCSERAVLRLSGPSARAVAARVFAPALPDRRGSVQGHVHVRRAELAAMALVMPGPRSFTGEDVVELHVPGSPLLVQLLQEAMLVDGAALGVRLALPGEFTARAVRNGRMDAMAVEGLLMLLAAGDAQAAAAAVQWVQGGLGAAVVAVRGQLQDVLALLEAGLDFTDDETGVVATAAWLEPLQDCGRRLQELLGNVPAASPGGELLLHGRANAGKSSLANALAGSAATLVDGTPGTTRDLLRVAIGPRGAVWDAPGDLEAPGAIDAAALSLRDRLAAGSSGRLLVVDAAAPESAPLAAGVAFVPCCGLVWTKADRQEPPAQLPPALAALVGAAPVFVTSAATGRGIEELRHWLLQRGSAGLVDAGGPLRLALQSALAAVQRGGAAAAAGAGPELVAVELQTALAALDGIAGQHSPEHLLDRIYGSFCLGK